MAEPDELLARLAADLAKALKDDFLSLAIHGSWVLGDFAPGRSDLDLLAVMATDPTVETLTMLRDVHTRLATDFPEWDGHVEVEYVSVEAIEAVVQATGESHPMISIGGGEPLHEVEASRHYVLNWAAALQADRPIAGDPPSTLLPAIEQQLVRQVTLQHVRGWPQWVDEMQHTGGQAYTVLTLCRAAEALATGRQVSKLAAAETGVARFPSGPSSSSGPERGGTMADPIKRQGGSAMCTDSSMTSARSCCSTTTPCLPPPRVPRGPCAEYADEMR